MRTDELKISYKLYALNADREGMEAASRERFCRITPFYILVYVAEGIEPPQGGVELTQTETHRLSKQDEQWLLDCNVVILAEAAKRHEAQIAAEMKDQLDRIEMLIKGGEAETDKKGE